MGNEVDELIVGQILELKEQLVTEYSYLKEALHKVEKVTYYESEQNLIRKQMNENENQTEKLLDALGRSQNDSTSEMILKRLDEINVQQEKLKKQLEEQKKSDTINAENFNCELLSDNLISLNRKAWDLLSPAMQKDILKKVIKEIVWDGEYATIHLLAEDEPSVRSA
jgi:hypothetical protein